MPVRRFFVFALLGLGLGFAALSWRSSDTGRDGPVPADAGAARAPPSTDAICNRPSSHTEISAAPATAHCESRRTRRSRTRKRASSPGAEPAPDRIDLLIAAGFSPDRAAHVVRRESELRVAAAYEEYAASGTVRPLTGSVQNASAAKLRAELGDDEFERFLRGARTADERRHRQHRAGLGRCERRALARRRDRRLRRAARLQRARLERAFAPARNGRDGGHDRRARWSGAPAVRDRRTARSRPGGEIARAESDPRRLDARARERCSQPSARADPV